MRKTVIATIVATSFALSIPAFAQVAVGGGGRLGVGVQTGGLTHSAMQTAGHAGMQADQTLQHTAHRARHATHRAENAAHSRSHARVDTRTNASIHAGAAGANTDTSASMGAGLDTSAAAGKAGAAGRSAAGQVRDTTHQALQSGEHTAGAIGHAAKGIHAGGSASAQVHGH
ncbi:MULTISPECIES: hypothetical protein [Rhodanobacter]|uniref:Uncharacterized protein n=1 Tax=Rhodanobacter glycinis TaxID=582702 RepID=A0A1I3YWK3_9GAMM|nr:MULTISPECIES: hypothetical protein [Rhodanobacter]SFK35749.1 hypothetical protein SAMN05192579_10262 [Rhodanobacter glycinis]